MPPPFVIRPSYRPVFQSSRYVSGAGGGFSPLDFDPGLWLDPSQLDLSDGANVSNWPDLSGNSLDATPAATAPTFDESGPNGLGWLDSPARTMDTPSMDSFPSKRGTWFFIYRPTATVSEKRVFGTFQGGTSPVWAAYNNNEFPDRALFTGAFETTPFRLQNDLAGDIIIRCVRRTGDTAWDWWRNGQKQWDLTPSDTVYASNPIRIGQQMDGKLGEVIFYPRALSDSETDTVYDYLLRKWAGGPGVNFVTAGDSQTRGNFGEQDDSSTFPYQLFTLLGSDRVAIRNTAESGSRWSELETRASLVDGTLSTKGRNVISVWCGTNEAYLNDAPASLASAESYLADRKAAGWEQIIVLTAMDRGDQSNETWRTAYNTGLRNLCSSEGYTLCDIAADPRIGAAGAYTDTTYFQVDQVHLNSTGCGVVADLVDSVATPILGL